MKIVTGDTPATAKEIGRQIGLWTAEDTDRNHITGTDFAALSDVGINSPAFNRIGLCGRSLGSSCRIRSIVDLLNLTCQSLQVSIRQGHCERSTSPAAHAG